MKSIGEAIQYLHSINIAHRDVKVTPAYRNPMLPETGGTLTAGSFRAGWVCSPVCGSWGLKLWLRSACGLLVSTSLSHTWLSDSRGPHSSTRQSLEQGADAFMLPDAEGLDGCTA